MDKIWGDKTSEINKLFDTLIPSKSMRQIHSHRQKFRSKGKLDKLIEYFKDCYKSDVDSFKKKYFLNNYDTSESEKKEVYKQIRLMLLDSKFEKFYSSKLLAIGEENTNILINSTAYPVLIGYNKDKFVEFHFLDSIYFDTKDQETLKSIKIVSQSKNLDVQSTSKIQTGKNDLVMPNLIERYLNFYGSSKTGEILSSIKEKKEIFKGNLFNTDLSSMINNPKTPNLVDSNLSNKQKYWDNNFYNKDQDCISLRSRLVKITNNKQLQNLRNASSTSLFQVQSPAVKSPISYNRFTARYKPNFFERESPMMNPPMFDNNHFDSALFKKSAGLFDITSNKRIYVENSLSSFSKTQASKSQKSIISDFTVK